MLTPEQISYLVDQIVSIKNKGNKAKGITLFNSNEQGHYLPHYYPGYTLSVEWLQQIRTHAQKGVFPELLFAKQAPNQTPKEAEYVRANCKQTTIQVFKDMVDTCGRAYHENNWSIEFLEAELGRLALLAFEALACCDFARADFRLDAAGAPRFPELNPLPTFAPEGSFAIVAELLGCTLEELLAEVLALGLARLGLT